uniref:Radial spoke head 3 n=1 Tax=Petromyzon marinus TaxID=7757 RepID=S4RYX0_PETMA
MTAFLAQAQSEAYTFTSRPRPVPLRAPYSRESPSLYSVDDGSDRFGNIMYDRRVVRGNTYAQHLQPTSAGPDPVELQRQQESRRRALARKRAKAALRPFSPEPVEGRKHVDVQTELYLEELSGRVQERDWGCQTDAFLDRPASPLFIPAKSGRDATTQILPGELFDFEVEVRPLVEVLVGKTVEQSLLEVMEEEELASLRAQQRAFLELRNAERAEAQRLHEQDRRLRAEKDRRRRQQQEVVAQEKEVADKVAARAFAKRYLGDLIPAVFSTLRDICTALSDDPTFPHVSLDVENAFMPWLMNAVEAELQKALEARALLDSIIRDVAARRERSYGGGE